MKNWIRILLFSGMGLGILIFIGMGLRKAAEPQAGILQGEVEATEIDVAAKLAGRIAKLHIRLGQKVKAGDILFELDSPELNARLQQALAGQDAAGAVRLQTERGARDEDLRAARSQARQAQIAADLAEVTWQRIERLYIDGVVPRQRRDEVRSHWLAAQEKAQAAEALYEKVETGARDEELRRATALEAQAEGLVAEVEAFRAEAKIHAPRNGEVSLLLVEQGELAPAGFPVVSLIDLDDVWVVFQLREDDLRGIGPGTVLNASIPALGIKSASLNVDYLAAKGRYATWRATSASKGYDLRMFELRARFVEPIEGLRPGMTVIVPR